MNNTLPASGKLVFEHAIPCWDEGLPLGNGFCGALIWGPSEGLRFSLDRGDLWDATPCEAIRDPEFTYANLVRFAREGREDEIRRVFDAPYNHPVPTKLPAGKLVFDFGSGKPQRSVLEFARAEAVIQVGDVELQAFVHACRKYGMIRIAGKTDSFSMRIENPAYGLDDGSRQTVQVDSVATASLQTLRYPAPEKGADGELQWFTQKIGSGEEYGVFVRRRETQQGVEIAWRVASTADGPSWKEDTLSELAQAIERGYDREIREHLQWWEAYWNRSGLRLPDPLFEKNWYLTNYLLGSCSRKGCYPMPLQGVWTADDGHLPPWKGDYHHDLNTEMSYYSYLKAGHFAEGESFLDYLWNMRDCARRFAHDFYDAEGICLPGTMTQTGDALGGWGMYSLSPANQLWLCQSFERHWRITGDRKFLCERAYPYLCDTAQFLLSLLEERDGMYYLPVSSSPEIHDDTIRSFLTPNTNYDLSLMRWLFGALTEMSEQVGDGRVDEWQAHLAKLPQLAVSDEGVLLLSPDEALAESHRHLAHAMAIHPLRLIGYDTPEDRRIVDATIHDLERWGTGYWVGFSFTWMAELYAVQQNGNGAAYQLQVFWNNHCSPNGFHLNGDYRRRGTSWFHYRPFTLEANFCAADALQEMLLQSEGNRLRLFAAVPDEWKEKRMEFVCLRAEQGVQVSAVWDGGAVREFCLQADSDTVVWLHAAPGLEPLAREYDREGEWLLLPVRAGQPLRWDWNA